MNIAKYYIVGEENFSLKMDNLFQKTSSYLKQKNNMRLFFLFFLFLLLNSCQNKEIKLATIAQIDMPHIF
jgi:hypothetical protein